MSETCKHGVNKINVCADCVREKVSEHRYATEENDRMAKEGPKLEKALSELAQVSSSVGGFDPDGFRNLLRCLHPVQKELAKRLRISPQYLCDILNGRREPSDEVAKAVGFQRIVRFIPLNNQTEP